MKLEDKIKVLEDFLRNKKCILGFSAGSDSTLIAHILSRVSPDSLLVTINNNMMPEEFIDYTKRQAEKFGLNHIVIDLDFLSEELFQNNPKERCYECRKLMYSNIQKLPEFEDYDYFLEGTNITDLLENRPGILVLEMFNMTSPLVECDITKDDVFDMIKYFDLEYSYDTTCLATRIKTDQKVDSNRLNMISEAEKFVRERINQENIRVRFDNFTAVITVDEPLDILNDSLIMSLREKLQKLGFKKVFLDITGYEKTKLVESIDDDGNYYYQLPYAINLEKTKKAIEQRDNLNGALKLDENLYYDDIIIQKDGKIIMPPTNHFVDRFNLILGSIKRDGI